MKLACHNLVVGGCISSVVYASQNNYNLICDPDLKPFKLQKKENILLLDIWSNLVMDLALKGMLLNNKKIENIRLDSSDCVFIESGASKAAVTFEKCYVFDTKKLNCKNDIKKHNEPLYTVYDWIDTRSCSFHELSYMKFKDDFVNELYFYESNRVDGKTKVKDIVAVSNLSKDQLNDFNYSDTMARFKITSIMESHGIKGARSGYQKDGKIKRSSIKIEPRKREAFLASENEYINTKKIKFLNLKKKKDNILLNYVRRRIK